MSVERPPIPTEQRKPAWRLACLAYRAKRREGASHREAHEAAVAAVQVLEGCASSSGRFLTAPTFDVTPRGIQVESKDEIKARLGRSPDRGDSVVMAWSEGQSVLREAITRRPNPDPSKPRPKSYLDQKGSAGSSPWQRHRNRMRKR